MDEHITSASNPIVKQMRLLTQRKHRRQQGAAVVYGIQPVWQAIEAGVRVSAIVYSPPLLKNPAALRMVEDQEQAGTRVIRISAELFGRLDERDGPGGLAAIVDVETLTVDRIEVTAASTFVALHQISNPGNLGTILRTADATGVNGVLLIGATADPTDPTAIKASMGAVFNVPIARVPDTTAFFDWARANDVTVATTSAHATDSLWAVNSRYPLAVLMGSEGSGLDESDLDRGGIQLSIPMVGRAESLNLAVATGIVLYELWRQRSVEHGG